MWPNQPIMPLQACIPPRVQAAFQLLGFCEGVRTRPTMAFPGDMPPDDTSRGLTGHEQAAYNVAIDCIRNYLVGESDYEIEVVYNEQQKPGDENTGVPAFA
jgi:hypothetical protein